MLQPSKARRASPRLAYAPTAAAASVSDTEASSQRSGRAEPTCVEGKAGVAGRPEHLCQLAEAGGRPTLDLALSGRIKAEEGASAKASGRLLSP